jgi:hypothetical protein
VFNNRAFQVVGECIGLREEEIGHFPLLHDEPMNAGGCGSSVNGRVKIAIQHPECISACLGCVR